MVQCMVWHICSMNSMAGAASRLEYFVKTLCRAKKMALAKEWKAGR